MSEIWKSISKDLLSKDKIADNAIPIKKKINLIDVLLDATLKTEGLIPGQTPLRFGDVVYKNTIQGYPIDWDAWKKAPEKRKNFYYVAPENVNKVIRKQWKNYFNKPSKYKLTEDSSLENVIGTFDKERPQNKLDLLQKQMIDKKLKIKQIKEIYDLSALSMMPQTFV